MADTVEKKEEPPKAELPQEELPKTEPSKEEPPKAQPPPPEIASDPEEDDLSDLDDVLDEFASTKLDTKPPIAAPPTIGPHLPAPPGAPSISTGPAPPDPFDIDDDEFAQQLQSEMEQLLGQGGLEKQFEEMMKGMAGEGLAGASTASPSTSQTESKGKEPASETAKKAEASFQETIKKTMERMQESGDQASAAAASSDGDDILAQMLKEMEGGSFGGEGGDDEDFSKILMGMMEQLTNKEILYEPMKELHEKFPKWVEANKGKVPEEDWKRYEEQQQLVGEITERFERKGYSDSNAQDREYIVERMQKMQAAGSPPPDLVGDMNAAQEALQEIDQGCPTQ
ncbi:Pex19-domain-containing protein [Amniculicola lignicola CBS 123094]|uniref:Pex19-domain-containing protein n=1 Tax=Amniculicola lignicola CBS 123094 TaxID=1392246 RepID=A0A6A5WL63_9PLEO|nr:Pex19-domain-containing protein [Amniculicola lignicola CBS 123094]